MRKSIYAITALLFATLTFTACLKDNDTVSTPECSITSFTVGDFVSRIKVTRSDGTDTTYSRTISGKNVFFNIDQVNNVISNVDSLVSWANITRLVPSVSADGTVIYKNPSDSLYRYLNSGKDSIDFTKPVEFIVMAYDGVNRKTYTVKVNKSATDADSLIWVRLNSADITLKGKSHSVVANNNLYVFAENDGEPTVCSTSFLSEGVSWTQPVVLTGAEGTIDYTSVVVFKGDRIEDRPGPKQANRTSSNCWALIPIASTPATVTKSWVLRIWRTGLRSAQTASMCYHRPTSRLYATNRRPTATSTWW